MNFATTVSGFLSVLLSTSLLAQGNGLPDFSSLSLQELSLIKVTSVSNTQQTLSHAAGAVYVISQEEIHRSGMTNVADLLRLVPGLSVARLNSSEWAVTSRGFNGRFANKLLVLIDGRSVYTPIFSGVYWDMCMPLLDDIERIEVIRGSGAAVWGANAVNGVINIITRAAGETKGVSVTAGGGTQERAFGQVLIGGKLTEGISYRGYFSGNDRGSQIMLDGQNARDGWSDEQGGFRIDGVTRNGGWQLEGNIYRSRLGESGDLFSPQSATGQEVSYGEFGGAASNLAFEWRHRVTENSDLRITTYYDFMNRPEVAIPIEQTRTGDFEIQYHLTAAKRHEISVGLTDRLISEKVVGTGAVTFNPQQVTYQLASGFAQDEIHYLDDRLLLTFGVKLEHSIFGGWQPQPTARALWAPNKRHSAWVAFSRAVRTPAFYERAVTLDATPPEMTALGIPAIGTVNGSSQFHSEVLESYEIGYRAQPSSRFSIDIAAFYDDYDNLNSEDPGPRRIVGGQQPYLVAPYFFTNNMGAHGVGGEVALVYHPFSWWKLAGSYSYLNLHEQMSASAPPGTVNTMVNAAPGNQWKLQSYVNLSKAVQFDTLLFSASTIQAPGDPTVLVAPSVVIPPHTRLDVRLGWRVSPRFEVSLSGQDLLCSKHLELTPVALTPSVESIRGYYLKTTWRF